MVVKNGNKAWKHLILFVDSGADVSLLAEEYLLKLVDKPYIDKYAKSPEITKICVIRKKYYRRKIQDSPRFNSKYRMCTSINKFPCDYGIVACPPCYTRCGLFEKARREIKLWGTPQPHLQPTPQTSSRHILYTRALTNELYCSYRYRPKRD